MEAQVSGLAEKARKDSTVKVTFRGILFTIATAMILVIIGIGAVSFFPVGDGIKEDKMHAINATYEIDAGAARQFDFKDRNVAKGSIAVLTKHGGIQTVVFDPKLPPSTVVKHRVYVSEKVREGTVQPAYNYIEWRWNAAVLEVQRTSPTVIPRR